MKQAGLSFEVSDLDYDTICRIVDRYISNHVEYQDLWVEIQMCLVACHASGYPLDLAKLEAAPDADLIHDVVGIYTHISRQTGRLMHRFSPRCATKQ